MSPQTTTETTTTVDPTTTTSGVDATQNIPQTEAAQEKRGFFRESFKSIREATAKFITFSASHHFAMLSNIRSGPAKPLFKMGFIQIPRLSMRVKIAAPQAIFANLNKPQPIHLKARIQKLKEFKINDSNRDKILDAIIKEKIKKLKKDNKDNPDVIFANDELTKQNILKDLVDGKGNSLEGEALWEKLHDLDPTENKTVYRKLMLQESGLRGARYAAEMVQNGIKLATIGIIPAITLVPGISMLATGGVTLGGLALGGVGMLIGSRLLSMASYPILNAITAYQDNLAGKGYTKMEIMRAGLNNLPLAITSTLLGSFLGGTIQKEIGKAIQNMGGSEAVKYGLNTISRIMFMSGSAAAANILSGWLQSRHFNIEKKKINENLNLSVAKKKDKLKQIERKERIAKGVVLAGTPIAAGIYALNQEFPHLFENAANQVARIEARNTYNPADDLVSNYQAGTSGGFKVQNALGNSDLGPTQSVTQTRLFTEFNVSAGGVQNQGVGGVGGGGNNLDLETIVQENNTVRNSGENVVEEIVANQVTTQQQTQSPVTTEVELGLSNMVNEKGGGPTEWGTAAGLVEESINYIRTHDRGAVHDVFKEINIDLSLEQISDIQGGAISEETINELLRASVVMQQGSKLYPNGSATEIFEIFERRANAENGGEVLDGYARLNDAPADNPYKTVQGILEDNKGNIEDRLSSANVVVGDQSEDVDGVGGRGEEIASNDSGTGQVDNPATTIAQSVSDGQPQPPNSYQPPNDIFDRIAQSNQLTDAQKTELVAYINILKTDGDGQVLVNEMRAFYNTQDVPVDRMHEYLTKAKQLGFFNPDAKESADKIKLEIDFEDYAKTSDFGNRYGSNQAAIDEIIEANSEDTITLVEAMINARQQGTIKVSILDSLPQNLKDIPEEMLINFNRFWNGLPRGLQVALGLGGLVGAIFLLREGYLALPYEMLLTKGAKRAKYRRYVRRRNLSEAEKEQLLVRADDWTDTKSFAKAGVFRKLKRDIKKAERDYVENFGKRGSIAWRTLAAVRNVVAGTRGKSEMLLAELVKAIIDRKAKIDADSAKSDDQKKQEKAKLDFDLQNYRQLLQNKGNINRVARRAIRRVINGTEENQEKITDLGKKAERIKVLRKYWKNMLNEVGAREIYLGIPNFGEGDKQVVNMKYQVKKLDALVKRYRSGKDVVGGNRYDKRVEIVDAMIERLEKFENRDKAFEKYVDLVKGMLNNTDASQQFDQFDFGIDAIETLRKDIQNGDVKEEEVEDRLKAIAVPLDIKRAERIKNIVAKDTINAAVNAIQDGSANTEFIDEIRTLREELDKKIEKGYVDQRKAEEEMNDVVERARLMHMRRVNKGRLSAGIEIPLGEDMEALRIGNPLNIRRQRQRLVNKKIRGEKLTEDEEGRLVELEQRLEKKYEEIQEKKKEDAEIRKNKDEGKVVMDALESELGTNPELNTNIDREQLQELRRKVKRGEINKSDLNSAITDLKTEATTRKSIIDRQQADTNLQEVEELFAQYGSYVIAEAMSESSQAPELAMPKIQPELDIMNKYKRGEALSPGEETKLNELYTKLNDRKTALEDARKTIEANRNATQPIFDAFKNAITDEDNKYLIEGEVDSIREMVNQGMSKTDVDIRIAQIRSDLAQRKTDDTAIKTELDRLDVEIQALGSEPSKKAAVLEDGLVDRRILRRQRYETLRKEIEEARNRNDYVVAKAKLAKLQELVRGRQEQYDRRKTKQDNKEVKRDAKEAKKKAVVEGKNNTVQNNKTELERRRDEQNTRFNAIDKNKLNQEQVAEYDKIAGLIAEVKQINLESRIDWRVQKGLYNRKLNAIREKINSLESNIKNSSST